MASGTWTIFNPQANAYETLDRSLPQHQILLQSKVVTLRDNGFTGTATQDTDFVPVSGKGVCYCIPVDIATYTAGTIIPLLCDPVDGVDLAALAQGAGSCSIAGTVTATAGAARASVFWGMMPPKWKWRGLTWTGAGTCAFMVIFIRDDGGH